MTVDISLASRRSCVKSIKNRPRHQCGRYLEVPAMTRKGDDLPEGNRLKLEPFLARRACRCVRSRTAITRWTMLCVRKASGAILRWRCRISRQCRACWPRRICLRRCLKDSRVFSTAGRHSVSTRCRSHSRRRLDTMHWHEHFNDDESIAWMSYFACVRLAEDLLAVRHLCSLMILPCRDRRFPLSFSRSGF
jgi:hypothetical protein